MKFEFITRTIGRRLITGFTAMLLLIALVGVMGVLGLNTIRITVEDQLARDFQLQDLAGQAEAEKNEARQAEKDFLLRYEQLGLEDARAQYVTLVTTHAANLRDKLTGIEIIERQRGNTEAADRVLTITDMVNAYETGFVDVVTLLETRGLQDDGLIGIFGESVDALESLITEISDPWLTVLVLQMRRRETDYMLSNDLQLINQIDVLVDQFIAQLTETTLTDQQHRDARILAENYLATLQEVVAIDTQVGEGIVRYSDAADAVEPELELVVSNARGRFAEAESSVLSQARFLVTAIVLVIAVAIAAGFGFAFATARSISHPLSEVTRTAGEIAAGDLDRRVRVDSQDEIGLLARNFNSMAENLQDMVESERGRKRVLERTVSDYLIFVERVTSGDLAARLVTDQNDKVQGEINDELIRLAENLNTMAANLDQMVRRETESRKTLESTVTEYMSFVQQVTDGDLTNRLELDGGSIDDEETEDDLYRLGVNLNTMVKSLADMARQFRAAAASVSSAATEIQATTTQQLASATEQDVTVTETVATLEEVRTTVLQTSERAQAVTQSSQQSVEVSRAGQEAVADSIEGMVTIRQRVENIAENILMLSERTQQIGEIIDTVNALADQSKLLALNASIEAARAGEEGKGFAVVALEVRQLAEQSRAATARVRDILSEIQQATNTAVMVTEEGSKGAEAGMTLVQRAGETIYELAETLEEAAQASMQIAASTQQQTNGMDQLAQAMAQIKQATTQTAASTQQAEQSVRDLIETARQLEQAAARYQL